MTQPIRITQLEIHPETLVQMAQLDPSGHVVTALLSGGNLQQPLLPPPPPPPHYQIEQANEPTEIAAEAYPVDSVYRPTQRRTHWFAAILLGLALFAIAGSAVYGLWWILQQPVPVELNILNQESLDDQ